MLDVHTFIAATVLDEEVCAPVDTDEMAGANQSVAAVNSFEGWRPLAGSRAEADRVRYPAP